MSTEFLPDAPADSSTATDASPSAGTLNTDQASQPEPFHTHPRWQQMVAQNRALTGQNQEIQQRAAALEARLQQLEQRSTTQTLTPDEEMEHERAARALERLFDRIPWMKQAKALAERHDELVGATQGVQHVAETQTRAQLATGSRLLQDFAKQHDLIPAGVASNPAKAQAWLRTFGNTVGFEVRSNPEWAQRWRAGDVTVLAEAAQQVMTDHYGPLRGQQSAGIEATKNLVRNLPPRPGGSAAGGEGTPKLEPGNDRKNFRSLNDAADKYLRTARR